MAYGYCRCGAEVVSRTRGVPSHDTCLNGHTFHSELTLSYNPLGKSPMEDLVFKPHNGAHKYECKVKLENKFVSPCPPPTPYEAELLTIMMEECAEVTQRASKMMRFGVEEVQPGQHLSNRKRLSEEVGQLIAMIESLKSAGLLDQATIRVALRKKHAALAKYMQTEPEKGEKK